MVEQAILAGFCWVLAPEIIRLLDMNARGIFGFRLTAVGVVFHLVAIQMTIILSYYDLAGRTVAVWGSRTVEHTSELPPVMRIPYAVFCLQKKTPHTRDYSSAMTDRKSTRLHYRQ